LHSSHWNFTQSRMKTLPRHFLASKDQDELKYTRGREDDASGTEGLFFMAAPTFENRKNLWSCQSFSWKRLAAKMSSGTGLGQSNGRTPNWIGPAYDRGLEILA